MAPSVEQVVRETEKAIAKHRRETHGNPAKAKAFLIRAGIAEPCKSAPNGIRLVKELRD